MDRFSIIVFWHAIKLILDGFVNLPVKQIAKSIGVQILNAAVYLHDVVMRRCPERRQANQLTAISEFLVEDFGTDQTIASVHPAHVRSFEQRFQCWRHYH